MKKILRNCFIMMLLGFTLFLAQPTSAANNREDYHIDEMITIDAGETITINDKEIYRDVVDGPLFKIKPGGSLNLINVKVDGNNGEYAKLNKQTINSPLIYNDQGKVVIENSIIENVKNDYFDKPGGTDSFGGIILNIDGNVKIDGSTFENNMVNEMGAFMYQTGPNKISNTIINNSKIIKNYTPSDSAAFAFGGATTIASGTMTITNTLFDNNMAGGWEYNRGSGGAIFNQGDLTLDNVKFTNNLAYMGGAITHQRGNFEVTSTIFDNNEALTTGGALHLPEKTTEINIYGVAIADNYATEAGGAIYNCPTGRSVFNFSNSIATYDNKADKYGDTIGKKESTTDQDWLNVEKYSLTGFKNEVFLDTVSDPYQEGDTNPIDRYTFNNEVNGLKIKTKGKQQALENAEMVFTNNKAELGGAIYNNSYLIFGDDISKALKVIKKWDSSVNTTQIPNEITVALMIGDQEVERVTLSKDNNWEYTFPHLPVGIDYSVKEVDIKGDYYNSIKKEDDGNGNVTFTITNYQKDLSVEKHWDDNNDSAGKRPGSIEVGIYENGKELEKVVLNKDNNWKHIFNNLDLNKDYEVKELNLSDDYMVTYDKKVDEQGNITYLINNHLKADKQIDISVIKKWSDMDNKLNKRPVDIMVGLYADDELIDSVKLSKDNDWQHTFINLPASKNYYVKEFNISSLYDVEYSKEVDENGNLTLVIVNTIKDVDPEIPTNPTTPIPNTGSGLIVMSLGLLFISGISLLGYQKYFNRNK